MDNKLEHNKTTGPFKHIYVEKDYSVYMECPKHPRTEIEFTVFSGDSLHMYPTACPICIEEAKESGRKEVEGKLWERIIDRINIWRKEATND